MRAVTIVRRMTEPTLSITDPAIAELIDNETRRQSEKVRLIASENYTSRAVMGALGSALTNKYSEGYPRKRYYEGNEFADEIETLAIERAKSVFGVDHANVQPYSGSPAVLACYAAFLEPGDTVLGLSLPMGGHLTHGWGVSMTGKWFNGVAYSVRREDGRVDMDDVRSLALSERPKMIICGGTAIPRTIDFPAFREIADEVGAILMADISHLGGLVAGGSHPSPAGIADVIVTTTHKSLRGPRGAMIMTSDAAHAKAVNKAIFPGLQGGPHNNVTAGIAVALKEAATPEFRAYAAAVVANAGALASALTERGFELVTGGTDNHLLLVDLTSKGIGGKPAAKALDKAGIVLNFNTVPYDPRKPFDPSGVRIGSCAVTSRGMGTEEMDLIAGWIDRAIAAAMDDEALAAIDAEVRKVTAEYPAPGLAI